MQVPDVVFDAFEDDLADDSTDMVDVLWECVAPRLASMRRARTAVLLTVASPQDRYGRRGRLHTLLHGESGTGKSVLRDWIADALDARKTGPKASEAGLKGSTKGGVYSPGTLPKADGGFFAPDELDEFSREDRGALLEAMSEGSFHISQDSVDIDVPAEVTVVAACNRTERFRAELLDRFDFTIEMEQYGADETSEVTGKLYDDFYRSFIQGESIESRNPLLPYLEWTREYEPDASERTIDACKLIADHLIHECGEAGDIRGKESLMRTAYTWARLNRDPLSPTYFKKAAGFIHPEHADEILELAVE